LRLPSNKLAGINKQCPLVTQSGHLAVYIPLTAQS
jgi:hypothetical protein